MKTAVMPRPQISRPARSLRVLSPLPPRRAKCQRRPLQHQHQHRHRHRHQLRHQLYQYPPPCCRSDTGLVVLVFVYDCPGFCSFITLILDFSVFFVMILQPFPVATQATTDFMKMISTIEQPASRPAVTPVQPVTTVAPSKPGPTLVKVRSIFSPLIII